MKLLEKIFNLFKKKPIIIPLTVNGKPNGTWIEVYKNDKYYDILVKRYGLPLPKNIEVEPADKEICR